MPSYLIAFDKFKDALSASEACSITAETLSNLQPEASIETAPLADGGDGFCDTLTRVAHGNFHECEATGPHGESLTVQYSIIDVSNIPNAAQSLLSLPTSAGKLAIIEMATSSGIAKVPLDQRDPWIATTAGVGDQIKAAIHAGADSILLGVGGSATHDLGFGALASLGYRFEAGDGSIMESEPTPQQWINLKRILLPDTDRLNGIVVRVACDVDNPLLGDRGSAAIFGPQKGLRPEDYQHLEALTSKMAKLLLDATSRSEELLTHSGAGAAGGIAFGLMASFTAELVPGYDLVKAWIGLDEKLARAETVITGEGRFDESSLSGKGPGSLLKETLAAGKSVYVFAGSLGDFDTPPISADRLIAISPPELPLPKALAATKGNLRSCITESFS